MQSKHSYDFLRQLRFVFQFKGTILKQLAPVWAVITIFTTLVCYLTLELKVINFEVSTSVPGLMSAVLGLLLVFRNNTAYDRWWEGRKILGGLVNTSRNFALQVKMLLPTEVEPNVQELRKLISTFSAVLRDHLRKGVQPQSLEQLSADDTSFVTHSAHRPNAIVQLILAHITKVHKSGYLSDFQMLKLVENTDEFIDLMGKCERIHKTPMPRSHEYLLKFYLFIYSIILPFSFIGSIGWWSILVVTLVYYVMMSLVIIAEEIEDPFGTDPNDLPVDQIVENIRKNVDEIMERTVNV